MKIHIFNTEGKKVKEIEMPRFFSQPIREDLVFKVLETRRNQQPYSPSPVAGKQSSSSGLIVHRRHVWRSGYGRGMSRIPRKIMLRRGSQFNWRGAEVSSTVGGRRAHPPKVISMINDKRINKKEQKIALISALSATANSNKILEKYSSIKEKRVEVPFIVESEITSLKTKALNLMLKNMLGDLYKIAITKKTIRSGRGKMRGRKYKRSAGMILVVGKDEKIKTSLVEVKNADNLSVMDLAEGGVGRLVVYTEKAIKYLENKLEGKKQEQ